MIFDGITLVEGSEINNLVVASGASFPSSPDEGELFYHLGGSSTEGLYIYKNGSWIRFIGDNESLADSLPDQPGLVTGDYRMVTVNVKGLVTAGSNPTTLAGFGITDAQPLDADLTAIANLAGISGVLRKTGVNTWTLDTGTYLTANQTITLSGDVTGSGATAITATLSNTGVAAGTYGSASQSPSIGVDAKGRVTSASQTPIQIDTSAVTSGSFASSRITEASVTQHQAALSIAESQIVDGSLLARNAGNESISGTWSFLNPVTVGTPTANGHAATKAYVDSISAGVNPHASVKVATAGPITLSGTQTIDGVAVNIGDRVLVKDQGSQEQNGVYIAASGAWTRASDFDGSPSSEVVSGDLLFVESGTVNANTSWVLITSGTITVGTTGLVFSLFSKAGELDAGAGLSKTGSVLNVGTASASRIVVNADNIDLATTGVVASTYRSVTVDAYGRVTGGTNPTTLAGYGITDAAALVHTHTASQISDGTVVGRSLMTAADAASARTTLELGTVATQNIGTSGATVPLLNTSNTWSSTQVFQGYTRRSTATGISAAGTNQGSATALAAEINVVSTVASGTGVILPSSIGTTFIVMNTGANALNVYPASGAAIDSLATNAAFSLSVGAKIMLIQSSTTQYHTLNATFA